MQNDNETRCSGSQRRPKAQQLLLFIFFCTVYDFYK